MKRWFSVFRSLVARLKRPNTRAAVVDLRLRYLPTYEEVQPGMEFELRRARRYERPLVVIVLAAIHTPGGGSSDTKGGKGRLNGNRADSGPDSSDSDAWFASQVSSVLLSEILHVAIREVDIVGYEPRSDRYIVCLPESDTGGAEHVVERIERLLVDRAVRNVRVGKAAFPRDALTLDDLVAYADHSFRKSGLSIYREEASA